MNISATELSQKAGLYLDEASKEPVVIEKTGRPIVVMVSYERYIELEDAYWGEQAIQSDLDESLSVEGSMKFLTDKN